ncbi:MAG: dihydroorotate dehydrogenase electron transfer subunit [Candidatus Omnitrophica bacterium CG08_land_8_20_14_0_20_41_16]|uniref:Dihydroorotate dehydrogenase B (NAD(+)), electron transfer subunit n=1 Tax=Candidatus Sherwoodlollariibacterium unditelluris TaxID=1974757 RepID=A0A2G9YHM3_9BACT|nr:MAG: hypothetical protein COX41_06705 [Candidatus Omnitrophica bacterium CG23_combo_of_CG06-09_8_20_14_all_41_10]PIS34140.1 MAG: dihydroorotate dehydrogenase electron transfer subunit [Candidatus Omnitrophica bacterium CG08_land_8_20_14_0_20_41_16]
MVQLKAKIIYNKKFKGDYWHCIIDAPLIAKKSIPGQFVNIKLSDTLEPFLRRPFSIHRIGSPAKGNFLPKTIEILYKIIGQGTEILSGRKKGEYLDIIGPLGNGFDYTRTHEHTNTRTILVAGGMGVAPLVFLSEKIKAKAKVALIGARTKAQVLCEKEFKNSGCDVKIATDDGSAGFKGKVTELLRQVLLTNSRTHELTNYIYACGPKPMLKAVAGIAKKYRVSAQISLEEHMACGIGACLGCVVKTKTGYKRACKDGPVFEAQDII